MSHKLPKPLFSRTRGLRFEYKSEFEFAGISKADVAPLPHREFLIRRPTNQVGNLRIQTYRKVKRTDRARWWSRVVQFGRHCCLCLGNASLLGEAHGRASALIPGDCAKLLRTLLARDCGNRVLHLAPVPRIAHSLVGRCELGHLIGSVGEVNNNATHVVGLALDGI